MADKIFSHLEYSKEAAKELSKVLSKLSHKEVKGEGTFEVIASTENSDRDGEVIKVAGWKTENFMKNPVLLFGHDYWSLPVGAVTSLEAKGGQLIAKGVFANTERGQEVRRLHDDGMLRAVSVGFIPIQREGNIITEAELLELSFVPVPANPEALSLAKIAKLDDVKKYVFTEIKCEKEEAGEENEEDGDEEKDAKGVVPLHDPPLADKDMDWDGDAAEQRLREWASEDGSGDKDQMDWAKYAKGFTWFDSENVEDFGSYKLPHHDIVDDEFKAVWRGVVAAMGAVLGARGGVDLSEKDRKGSYNHLANTYLQFDEEAPEFSSYSQYEIDKMFPGLIEKQPTKKNAHEAIEILQAFGENIQSLTQGVITALTELISGDEEPEEEPDATEPKKAAKAGRILSAKNRLIIEQAIEAISKADKPLQALLEMSEKTGELHTAKRLTKFLQTMDKAMEVAIKESKKLSQ